jgi:Predicted transcriptional regulators
MKVKRKEGYFSISAVAKMFSVHQQTVRLYEKQGLITPKRSDGNTRLFSDEDIDRLEEIIYLTHELGINLAGVEVIFKLKKQLQKMQKDMNQLFEKTKATLDEQTEQSKQTIQHSVNRLKQIKQTTEIQMPTKNTPVTPEEDIDNESSAQNWEIEYED